MIKLTVDGKTAVIKKNTSFKITRVNPFFEDAGDFSLEVSLPLKGCAQNQYIFGPLQHKGQELAGYVARKYPATLIADSLVIEGYARVSSADEDEVKVQLVGGKNNLILAINDSSLYIDELNLGKAWDDVPPIYAGEEFRHDTLTETVNLFTQLAPYEGEVGQQVRTMMHGQYPLTSCVCFPIFSKKEERIYNKHAISTSGEYCLAPEFDNPDIHGDWRFAPMPYLTDVFRRICTAVGLKMGDITPLTDTFRAQIFLANTRNTLNIARMLPHWTLAEFVRELEQLLSVVVEVDGLLVNVRERTQFYSPTGDAVVEAEITDDYSAEFDEEGDEVYSSTGNIGYAWNTQDDLLSLPEEVWENAELVECKDLAEVTLLFLQMSEEEKANSSKIFRFDHGYAAVLKNRSDPDGQWLLRLLNPYGPLFRNDSKKIDVELRMFPAAMLQEPAAMENVIMCSDDGAESEEHAWSVNQAVNPPEGEETTQDVTPNDYLQLGHLAPEVYHSHTWQGNVLRLPYAMGMTVYRDETSGLMESADYVTAQDFPPFGIFQLSGQEAGTVGREMLNSPRISTRAERVVQLIHGGRIAPTAPLLISGKLYACKKLEISITESGMAPTATGYLAEIQR